MLTLTYPHDAVTLAPARLRKEEVWRVGETARSQIFPGYLRPKVDVARVVMRCKELAINRVRFSTHWELGRPVTDDVGHPVLGAVEHDRSWPNAAMIYVNGDVISDRDDLLRSTSVHELGHAIFDVPSWVHGSGAAASPERPRKILLNEDSAKLTDWREWRANEFMGAFLAPRRLLHSHLHKRAAALGVPMVDCTRYDLPIVNGDRAGFDVIETLAIELAEVFGLSLPFMLVRLRKYGLISPNQLNA